MSPSLPPQVQELVDAQLAAGRFTSAEEVLLDALLKQKESQLDNEASDDWPAIKEALDEVTAGDEGRPAEEVLMELRKKYAL